MQIEEIKEEIKEEKEDKKQLIEIQKQNQHMISELLKQNTSISISFLLFPNALSCSGMINLQCFLFNHFHFLKYLSA